jgi:branched-subunit amino acid transport protein
LAALAGIVVPELLPWHPINGPQVDLRLLAAAIAVGVFVLTRNGFLLIVSGMAALWVSRWVFGL